MSLLTNQSSPMWAVHTKVFLKKVFLLEVLSYSLQLFWSKLSYLSDTSTDTEIKDSPEALVSTSSGKKRGYTEKWEAASSQAVTTQIPLHRQWDHKRSFPSLLPREHLCTSSTEHNWLLLSQEDVVTLSLCEQCSLQGGLLLPRETQSLPYPLQIHTWYLFSDKH